MTILLSTPIEILAEDASGAPLHFQAGAAHDHDGNTVEDIWVSANGTRYTFNRNTLKFTDPTPFVDQSATPITPDLLVAGDVQGSTERLIGMFGSDARLYNFASSAFTAAVPLVENPGSTPFTPIAADTVDVTGTGSVLTAVKAGSPDLYVYNLTQFAFLNALTPTICGTATVINTDVILSALLPGGGGVETVALLDGSNAHRFNDTGPSLCFDPAIPLTDSGGQPLVADFAFGWDWDGNGTDDVVLFDTVTVP